MRHLALIFVTASLAVASAQRYVPAPAHYKVRDEGTEERRSHSAAANPSTYLPLAATDSAQQAEDQGFVHPIDFSGLLRDSILGAEAVSSPAFGIGAARPLHLVQEPSSPFQSPGRLFPGFGVEQDKAASEDEKGFVDPNHSFRSFFDGAPHGGFQIKDFLTAHASSQKEVEDRVHAAADGTDDYKYDGRESAETGHRGPGDRRGPGERRGSGDRRGPGERRGAEESRRAAATEHHVYHDEDEAEDDDEGSEGGKVTKQQGRGRPGHYAGSGSAYRPQEYYYHPRQQEDSGPQQFGPSEGPYSSAASSRKEAEKSAGEPYYGPDYSKLILEEEAAAAEEGASTAPKGTANKGGKNCKKISKKVTAADVGKSRFSRAAKPAMTCYVCEDPANGGSYESCAYGSSPKDKSYFVSRAFSSKGKKSPSNKYRSRRYLPEERYGDAYASGTSNEENKEDAPEYEGSETSGIDSEKLAYEAIPGDSYDENFKRLFPEFNYREASASSPSVLSSSATSSVEESEDEEEEDHGPGKKSAEATEEDKATDYSYQGSGQDFQLDQAQKKHLEKLVGEFSQKDRTACKKVIRDKMTCFQCVDEKGMQHEECMFVAKSDPKGRHLAYHELKEYRLVPEQGDALGGASGVNHFRHPLVKDLDALGVASDHSTRVELFPHPLVTDSDGSQTSLVTSQRVPAPSYAASETRGKVESVRGGGRRRRKEGRGEDVQGLVEEEESEGEEEGQGSQRAATAEEEAIADGVYADETVQTFDPVRKIHLPKYMLKRSEHEAVFEEFVKSSRDGDN